MNIRESRQPIARAPNGATLYEIREDGPEGGGALRYRVQGTAPADAVEVVLSSDFSPGNGSRPQTVSPEMCRQRLAALGAEITRRKIPDVILNPEACRMPKRPGLVVTRFELSEDGRVILGPRWRAALPADLIDYVERRLGCNHWGGEEAYDKERRKEIEDGARSLRCDRIDADEKKLRKKYAGKADFLRVMDVAATDEG